MLDAYAPGLTDNVQRLCWSRGYICLTHGGGASMVAQTNDTDHHKPVRQRFSDLQTMLMFEKAGPNFTFASKYAWYKYTGTTVALDGSEDCKICREAKDFWQELGMRQLINSAVAEVETKFKNGCLPCTYKPRGLECQPTLAEGILMS